MSKVVHCLVKLVMAVSGGLLFAASFMAVLGDKHGTAPLSLRIPTLVGCILGGYLGLAGLFADDLSVRALRRLVRPIALTVVVTVIFGVVAFLARWPSEVSLWALFVLSSTTDLLHWPKPASSDTGQPSDHASAR